MTESQKTQCNLCPLKTGEIPILKTATETTTNRLCALLRQCEERRKECQPHISSKVSLKVFWPIVILFVGITSTIIAYSLNAQDAYRLEHANLHKDLNHEIKEINLELRTKVEQISKDVTIIKTKVEQGETR